MIIHLSGLVYNKLDKLPNQRNKILKTIMAKLYKRGSVWIFRS